MWKNRECSQNINDKLFHIISENPFFLLALRVFMEIIEKRIIH